MHKLLQKIVLTSAILFAGLAAPDASAVTKCEYTVECTIVVIINIPVLVCKASLTCKTGPGPEG